MGDIHALVARQHQGANTCCSIEPLLASGSINIAGAPHDRRRHRG